MRIISVLATILGLLSVSSATMSATIVGLWEFDNNYNDSAGNYDLTEFGSVPFVPGISGQAADFEGGSVPTSSQPVGIDYLDSITQPDKTIFNSSGMSIMGWMRHDQLNEVRAGPVFGQEGPASTEHGYALSLKTDGIMSFTIRDAQNDRITVEAQTSIIANEWTQYAITWDGSLTGGIQMYLDGMLISSNVTQSIGSFSGLSGNVAPIRIGGSSGSSSGGFDHGYKGQLDRLSLWQGALTAQEIFADYQSVVPVPSALLLFFSGLSALGCVVRKKAV